MMAKPNTAVIISTTRATRFGERPAKWAMLDELHWWASALMVARADSK
jgi:hypothetical protein